MAIVLVGNLTVDGGGEHFDALDDHRIFSVAEGVTAELRALTVSGGATHAEDDGGGAGIMNKGTLVVTDCTVSNNQAFNFGDGGGIFSFGSMMLTNSIISTNRAWVGGGIYTSGELTIANSVVSKNSGLDGIRNFGELTVTSSTVSENGATGIRNSGDLTVTSSTVSRNTSPFCGAGISNGGFMSLTDSTVSSNTAIVPVFSDVGAAGGGVCNGGNATLTNTTVARNTALECDLTQRYCGEGGGIVNGGTLTLSNSTISRNDAHFGGGIFNWRTLAMTNSTVSGNSAEEEGSAIYYRGDINASVETALSAIDGECAKELETTAPWTSNGYNIESPGDTCGFEHDTDLINVSDLNLGPLADNGGPTETHALLPGSVAIDVIPEAACEVDVDQRGVTRPQGPACDVGAFELQQ